MKRILFIISILVSVTAYNQTTGFFRYDTVAFQKVGGNSEFILLNGTRAVTGGVLTNLGNGRTRFVLPSGGSNVSLGSGYKIAVDGTNNVKSILAGLNITVDSATSGSVKITNNGLFGAFGQDARVTAATLNRRFSSANAGSFTFDSVTQFLVTIKDVGGLFRINSVGSTGDGITYDPSSAASTTGMFLLDKQNLNQVGFKFKGQDFGFARNEVENTWTPTLAVSAGGGDYVSASVGFSTKLTYSGAISQWYQAVKANPFCDSCLMIRNSGAGIQFAADGNGYFWFKGSASNMTSVYGGFAPGGKFAIGNTSPGQKLSVTGSFSNSDSVITTGLARVTDTTGFDVLMVDRTTGNQKKLYAGLIGAGGGGGSGTVTSVDPGYGLIGTPDPITTTGTVILDTTIAVNKAGAQVISGIKNFTAMPTFSTLTSGRVPFATTGGALTDDAGLTFDGSTNNLIVTGPASSVTSGPKITFKYDSDANAVMSYFAYTHDNIAGPVWDAHFNGSNWVSSYAGSQFALYKNIDELAIAYNAGTAAGSTFAGFNNTGGVRFSATGRLGIGVAPATKLHVLSTTEQLRLGYDASNYISTTVGSTGDVTYDAIGSGSAFTFSDKVSISTTTTGNVLAVGGAITPAAGSIGMITNLGGTITEAGSSTHAVLTGVSILAPVITNGAGATTDATSLYISGPATGITPTNPATAFFIAAGNVRWGGYGAGTATFDANGNITSVSDGRLKNIVGDYKAGLREIMQLHPIIYKWKPGYGETLHEYAGLDAREVYKVFGDLGSGENAEGYRTVQDRALIAALINSVKELQARVTMLEKKLK